MVRFGGSVPVASILAVGVAAAALAVAMEPALAAPFAATITYAGDGPDGANDWDDPDNWTPAGPPTVTDDVLVPTSLGAYVFDGESAVAHTMYVDGGVNVARGGTLTVDGDLTNSGENGYFINDGTITVDGGGTLHNTYDDHATPDDADDDTSGYISSTHAFNANVDNSGVIYNDGSSSGGATWTGDVSNNLHGFIDNIDGTWNGNVTDNAGSIYNEQGSTWSGTVDVTSSTSAIENNTGSTWKGAVLANGANDLINNLSGATWIGDVEANSGSINSNGGTWAGAVITNDGDIYSNVMWTGDIHTNAGSITNDGGIWNGTVTSNDGTISSTGVWNGDMTSSGTLALGGVVDGSITSTGTVYVQGALTGVTSFANNGDLNMDDGTAVDSLSAQTLSGTGSVTLDFSPSLGRADHIVLSGAYTADSDLYLYWIGPATGRAYGNMPLLTAAGGAGGGSLTLQTGLPDDGVISYRLVQTDDGWAIDTLLSKAPEHVADVLDLVGRTAAEQTQVPLDRGPNCEHGGWSRALGGAQAGVVAGNPAGVGLGGLQVGYDLACVAIPGSGAKLGVGMTAGTMAGSVSQDFGGEPVSGSFQQGFAGLYGRLVSGSLRAVLQSQFSFGGLSVSDRGSALPAADLSTTRFDFAGSASYTLALGGVRLVPELGFAAADSSARSSNFADVGAMTLRNDPTLDGYVGATLSADIDLPDDDTVLTPFARLALHAGLLPDGEAVFSPGAGGSASVPLDGPGSYADLSLGADLARGSGASGQGLGAGLLAEFKLGPQVTEGNFGGYAQVKF